MDAGTLRGWIDYERPKLHLLTPPQRIDYFERRVRLVVINPLRRILKTEIIVNGEDSSALLIFGVSICCAIEAAGKFLTGGHPKNAERFERFLKKYMSREFRLGSVGGLSYGEALRTHFRNGLAHGFAVRHGGFEGNPGDAYFVVKEDGAGAILEVNPSSLFEDFVQGFERYLGDLRRARPGDELSAAFHGVFESVFIRGE